MMTRSISLFLGISLFVALTACQRSSSDKSKSPSPKAVAEHLINALDKGDKATLASLVAVDAAKTEIKEIYAKRKQTPPLGDKKIGVFVTGFWRVTYGILVKGKTTVSKESIVGDRATVLAHGENKRGVPKVLQIDLAREKGAWKVLPKLRIR